MPYLWHLSTRKTIMELERASRARETADLLLNGGLSVKSEKSDSPQPCTSPKVGLKSMPSAPQAGEVAAEGGLQNRDAALLSEEVRRLRSQLQSATEKWARDKQMFAEVSLTCILALYPSCPLPPPARRALKAFAAFPPPGTRYNVALGSEGSSWRNSALQVMAEPS